MKADNTYLKSSFTVLFEAPFYIGIYERFNSGKYEVCKIIFGAEPTDVEIYKFMLTNWNRLKFTPPTKIEKTESRRINPKRQQREINRQLQNNGIGTKAQQALKLFHEQNKLERKAKKREKSEEEKERLYNLKKDKKKAKHKGR